MQTVAQPEESTFAGVYTMRSRFWMLLGEAGKLLADAYTQADLENVQAIKELAFDAMAHSLAEHHGMHVTQWHPIETCPEDKDVLIYHADPNLPWKYGLRTIGGWSKNDFGQVVWTDINGEE